MHDKDKKFLIINPSGEGALEAGISGSGIFITDVVPQNSEKVVSKTMTNKVGKDLVVDINSDTTAVRVYVEWDGASDDWQGLVSINGSLMPEGNMTALAGRRFSGYMDITLDFSSNPDVLVGTIHAKHSSGREEEIAVVLQPPGPEVLDMAFYGMATVGSGAQTELKENDTIDVVAKFDMADVDGIEVQAFGAAKSATINSVSINGSNEVQFTISIADNGDSLQSLGIMMRAKNVFGTFGAWMASTDGGLDASITLGDKQVATLPLNNLKPSISFGAATYPASQQALKDSEEAQVVFNYADSDSVAFTSGVSELSIADANVLPASTGDEIDVTRISGNYRVSGNNLNATATRDANDSSTSASKLVQIAHMDTVVSVSVPASRLRSGGNMGTSAPNYSITISSDQRLIEAPALSNDGANTGTLVGAWSWSANATSFSNTMQVHDNDTKGTFNWQGLIAKNLAGKIVSVINTGPTYVLGGFVERTVTFAAFTTYTDLGVVVSDTAKLTALNNSKGVGYGISYVGNVSPAVDKFTVVDNSGSFDASGDHVYNNDVANRESNASGTAQFVISEGI